VIFPKSYFPTEQAVRERYRAHFDIAATKFAIRDTDRITELGTFILLSRTPE
jgi:hypothetical protein